jgi:gliding motility-associated-like protein
MGNCIYICKRFVAVIIFCFSTLLAMGEGSKDLHPSGATGNRASLLSTTADIAVNPVVGIRFPNPGRHFVFAKVGEVIHVGSSAQGVVGTGSVVQTGTINLVAPDGSTYTSGTSTTVGRITGRSAELVGPTLDGGTDGGYTAYTVTVASGQEGIWVVDFIAPSNGVGGSDALNATNLTANASWTTANQQTNSRYIVAWDATVVSSGTRQTGRVYQTVFSADLSQAQNQFCHQGKFIVLSKDGYQYLIEPQTGFQPFQFAFFANNKGLRFNTGANIGVSAFRSAPNASVENASSNPALAYDYHTPNSADDATNITHKIFYNTPDGANLPATANIATSIYGTASTWLYTSVPVVPVLSDLTLVGKEGTSGKFSTTAPLTGGFINFNSNLAGSYRILIDANNDGDYTDAGDLTIRGNASAGANSVAWDGKDGQGNFIVNGGNIKINAVTLAGEVHFPLADAEKNVGGIKFTRTNGTGAPNYTIYWDDNLLTNAGTSIASSPTTNLDNGSGQSSETNGHKWGLNAGAPGTPAEQFGNEAVIDTWMNVFSVEQNLNVTINYQEADLEIVSLVGNLTNICVGTEVTYTFIARNNGPNNSGDATVSFVVPTELTNLSVVSATVTSGTATGVGGTFSGTTFTDVLSMDNGAVVTYVVKGTIASYPSGGNLNTSARILRAADVTDPDATNDDVAPPTDPTTECNGNPSGVGCNNIKDLTTTVFATPSTAALVSPATLTNCNNGSFTVQAVVPTTGTGAWSVISGTATVANLTNTTTNVTAVGAGQTVVLRWTVSNGTCTPSTVDITLVNNALPSTAALVSAATLTNCNNGSFTVQAVVPTTGTGAWSVISGTATVANLTNTTTNVTAVGAGQTVVLRWTVSNGTCTPSTVDITLVNNALPSTAALVSAATLTNCNNGSFTVQAVVPTTGTGAWSVISGTATVANLTNTTTNVTAVGAGQTVVLRWTVSNGTCTPSTVDITLINNAAPSTAALVSAATLTNCNNGSFNIEAVVPTTGTGAWSVISGTATVANLTSTTTNVSNVGSGQTVVLRWTVSNGTCTPSTVDITLVNNALPSTAALVSAATLTNCNNGSFTVQAVVPTTGTGAWSVISGTATVANLTNTTTNVTAVGAGQTVVLRWTVSNGTCTPSTVDITLINNAAPSTAALVSAATLTNCNNGSFNIEAVAPTTGTGAWSVISGTATIANLTSTTTNVSNVGSGQTVVLRWTVSNGTCTPSTVDITLVNNALPSTAALVSAATLTNCNNGSFTVQAVVPTTGTGAWSVISGTATVANLTNTTTNVTAVGAGQTVVLRWTVSNGTCTPSTVDISLINNAAPSTAALVSAATLTNCNNGSFNIEAVVPTTGTGAWSVISGTATVANLTSTTTNVSNVGTGETVVLRWTVSNGTCTPSTVDITLVNNALPSTAALVSPATLTNCNNGSFTVQAVVPTSGTGAWSVISGTATVANLTNTTTNVTAVGAGQTVVLRWTVSNGTCTPSTVDITLVNNAGPSAATLTTAATLTNCDNPAFNIGAVTPTVGTGQWSVFSGTATIANANATSTSVSNVTAGSTVVLRWTVSSPGCTSNTVDVTLVNNALPSTAALVSPATLTNCNNGSFTVQAVVPTTGTGAWSVISGTATVANLTNTTTNVTSVGVGQTVVLRWTVSNGTCTPSTVDITLVNNAGPSAATLTTAATLTNCDNPAFNIGAVTPTVGTGQWSVFSGTATIANANATSTSVSNVTAGTTVVLRWTVSSPGCTSNTVDVTLVNNALPSTAALVSPATLTNCNNGSFTVQAVVPTTGTGAWSVISGTATVANLTNTTTNVTAVGAGQTVVLRWTVSNGTCTPSTVDISLINNAAPSTAALVSAATLTNCNNGSFTVQAVVPTTGTGAWSVISGTATIANLTSTTTNVSNVGTGETVVLRWTVSNGTCTPSTVDITLVNNALPSTAALVSAATLTNCNNGSFTVQAVVPTSGTGAWSVISGTATVANLTNTTTNVTSVGVGQTVVLRWTVSNGTCTPSTVDITLVNNEGPSAATLTTAATLTNCDNPAFNIGAVTPTVGTGQWSVFSGTATIANANATSTSVSNITAGSTVVLRWTVSSPGCTSNTVDVTLVNNALPSTAALVSPATLTNCNNGSFTVQAAVPTSGTGVWSVISGTATVANLTNTTTNVTAVGAGQTVVLRWTVSNGTCTPSTVDITLVNNVGPSTATLTTAATLINCNDPVFNIAAVTPTVGTGQWSVLSGTATIANANATSTSVSNVTAGSTVVLRWTVSSLGCISNTVDVTLVNNALPSTAALVSPATLTNCNNGSFNIEAVAPTSGTGTWSVMSGTATIANVNAASTQVSAVTAGQTVVLRWTVSNGTCTPSTVDITLVNNNGPSTAIAGANLINCNNGTFTMAANNPVIGTGVWSVVSGVATITNTALTNTTVTGVAIGSSATLRWTITALGCPSSQSDIILTNQLPPSTANAGANQTNCNNGSFTMAALTPTVGTGSWSIVSGLATIMSSPLTNTSVTGIPVGTSTTLRWSVSNGVCPASTSDVILTNAETVNAGSNIVMSCTTTAKVPAALSGQTWTASGTNPSAASINSNGDITGLISKGVYQFTLANANCSVTITVTKNNCPPVALNDTQTVRNDQVLTGTLKPKVSDPDSDVLTLSLLVPPTRGTIVFNPDGTYTYTPPANYVGTDSITYRVCDADGLCADAKLYINITGVPKPPIAINDSTTTTKNIPVSGSVLGNDYDQSTNTNMGLTVTTTPVVPPANGSVILNANGTYTYTPANNFTGLDSFRYVICNAQALCDTATVYIRINEPPALQPKLEIEKRIDPKRIQYGTGERVTYTLVAKSTGNTTVTPVSVQDILPPSSKIQQLKMVQGSPTAGTASYEPITNIIFWSIPFIHAGDSAILKYTLVLSDSGTLVNTATISSPMTNGVTDTASVSINVVNQADIKITKLLRAPAVINVNDEIGFTMIAENFGPAIGTEVVVQDSLYANLSDPRSMTVNIGKVSYNPVTRKIIWRIDTLLVGQKDSLVIRVKVISGGEIRNGATVRAKQTDPVSGNNGAVVSNITGGQVFVEGRPFFIPSVFTPNGDGKNDKFTILGINRYPGSELTIYNRWGNVVYQSKDYKNDWDGRGLNEATYYYTLNLKTTTGFQKLAGWVQILR